MQRVADGLFIAFRHVVAILAWDAGDPLFVGFHGPIQTDTVLRDDVADRLHPAVRQLEVHFLGPAFDPVAPVAEPAPKDRTEVPQALVGEKLRRQGNHDVVGGNETRAVDGAEIEQDQAGSTLPSCLLHETPEGREHTKSPLVTPGRRRPSTGELFSGLGKSEVAGQNGEPLCDLFRVRLRNVSDAAKQRPQTIVHGWLFGAGVPEVLPIVPHRATWL